MKATDLKLCGITTISSEAVSICGEYTVHKPKEQTRMPVFVMAAEPKCDRRYFRREASF